MTRHTAPVECHGETKRDRRDGGGHTPKGASPQCGHLSGRESPTRVPTAPPESLFTAGLTTAVMAGLRGEACFPRGSLVLGCILEGQWDPVPLYRSLFGAHDEAGSLTLLCVPRRCRLAPTMGGPAARGPLCGRLAPGEQRPAPTLPLPRLVSTGIHHSDPWGWPQEQLPCGPRAPLPTWGRPREENGCEALASFQAWDGDSLLIGPSVFAPLRTQCPESHLSSWASSGNLGRVFHGQLSVITDSSKRFAIPVPRLCRLV